MGADGQAGGWASGRVDGQMDGWPGGRIVRHGGLELCFALAFKLWKEYACAMREGKSQRGEGNRNTKKRW